MKKLTRVVWSEGMHLGPQHFQAQARYFEDSIQFAISALRFAAYGVDGCLLDKEALHNGTVSFLHARGLFPDGLAFDMSNGDRLPTPRNISKPFSPIQESLTIFLGIKGHSGNAANSVLPESEDALLARFIMEKHLLHDENTGVDEKPLFVGRKNIRILLDSELTEDCVSLPVARILRDGSGHFIYDPNFIPPCLSIAASPRLGTITGRLIEILEEKSRVMSGNSSMAFGTRSSYAPGDVASFWFMHCVNSSIGPLRHLHNSTRGHPEELYTVMARLAGALCTFAVNSEPRSAPAYNHDHLTECFDALDKQIRNHLDFVIPTNCVTIPIRLSKTPCYYGGTVTDTRSLGPSQWILSVRAPIAEADLISNAPALIKVCSGEFVVKLVKRALPGLTLKHLEHPPAAASAREKTQYFSIERLGPCWDHIKQTRELGIYVPDEIPEPEIEILVVLEPKTD